MQTSIVLLILGALVIVNAAHLLSGAPGKLVPDQYIVVLNSNLTTVDRDEHILNLLIASGANGALPATVKFVYNIGTLIGFSAKLSPAALKAELEHPDVKYVEQDQIITLNLEQATVITQTGADWGLARTSQRQLTTERNYVYDELAGEGTDVFVIDTGIYVNHTEFAGGRAAVVYNAITDEPSEDLQGHGTHCAGTVGGAVYGIAKKTTLKGVKVLNQYGSGTIAGVIAGVDYVANNRVAGRPTVGSMSLGGGASPTLDTAVDATTKAGIIMVVAAGNSNADACFYSPAGTPSAVTVGAIDSTDTRAYYSNYGKCVDVFAPGSDITSAWIGTPTSINTISGTSMATPHVAGAFAVQLSRDAKYTADDIVTDATPGVVTNPGTGSPNKLLFSKYE